MQIFKAIFDFKRIGLLAAALLAWLPATAHAQFGDPGEGGSNKMLSIPAEKYAVAPGGVDMRSGQYQYSNTDIEIRGLALERIQNAGVLGHTNPFANFSHNWDVMVTEKRIDLLTADYQAGSGQDFQISVRFGGLSETFNANNGTGMGYAQISRGRFSSLTYGSGEKGSTTVVYTFQAHDGTVAVFRPMGTAGGNGCSSVLRCAYVDYIIQPDGTKLSFEYSSNVLRSITSTSGYALVFETNGSLITKACAINLSVMVKPSNNVCPSNAQSTVSYSYTSGSARLAGYTDPAGAVWSYNYGSTGTADTIGFVKPGQSSAWLTNTYGAGTDMDGNPFEVTGLQSFADGQSYTYTFDYTPEVDGQMSSIAGGSYTDALSHQTIVRFDFPIKPGTGPGDPCSSPCSPTNLGSIVYQQTSGPVEITDPLNRTTTFDYCDPNAMTNLPSSYHHRCIVTSLQSSTDPEGIKTDIAYDGWRNISQIKRKRKTSSTTGPAEIVTSATYNSCSTSYKSCAKPTSTTDANGNTTDYTYSADHGGILTRTGPAVQTRQANGTMTSVRPQTRYTYAQRYAWIKNSSGTYSQAATPIWVLTQESFCRVSAAATGGGCTATVDEVVTAYDYGPDSGPNTLQLRGKTVTADGVTLRTCFTYNDSGDKTSETSPRAGLTSCPGTPPTSASAFTTDTRYDAAGRVTGTIAADPDSTGSLKYSAVRNTYDGAGRLTKVEKGELSSWQADSTPPANWGTAFDVQQTTDTTYDALDRKLTEKISINTGALALTQYSYDLAGRLECTAVRMDPSLYSSLPSSACSQGANGSDRITRNTYDAAGQLLTVTEGYGVTADVAVVRTNTFTSNGRLATLADAENNKTTLEYDGQDRLIKMRMPSTTKGANASSTADYEEYGYDNQGNRTSFRKRDGSTLTYTFDALNRMTVKVVPSRSDLTSAQTRDVYYAYDLRNLQTEARFDSLSGEGVLTGYDGFGRLTSTSTTMGGLSRTIQHSYDSDGDRTGITYPDSTSLIYGYDALDRMEKIKNSSGVDQVTYTYNNKGDVGFIAYADNAATTLQYNNASQLTAMIHTFTNSGQGITFGFGYNAASQISSQTSNTWVYEWNGHYNVNRNYTANGLNQYSAAGSLSLSYDANGNLTGDGSHTYLYDIENRLVSASGGASASLVYDPLGRLFQTSGTATTQFLYDGDELIAEYDGSTGTLLRRYVHGMSNDDPVIWYEGSGLTSRRFLHRNWQGSIIGVGDDAGALMAVNTYDEYGIPGSGNLGRFQYTGQAWIPELGMYYYKARMYSPTLGRFIQTDPVGYDDQMNLYAYVGNDPVNQTDPSGQYKRGSGFEEKEWKKFNKAQQSAAKAMDKRASKLMKEAAKRDAKGKAGGDRLRQQATNLRNGAAELRDTSDGAAVANVWTEDEYDTKFHRPAGSQAYTHGRTTEFRRGSLGVFGKEGLGKKWTIGHEGLHVAGLFDQTGPNGALAYKGGEPQNVQALIDLRGTDLGANNPDNLLELVWP